MALDRTLSIKKRRIDVYLPTLKAKDAWNKAAAKNGMSLSQFVAQVMELELQRDVLEEAPGTLPAELQDELARLRQE